MIATLPVELEQGEEGRWIAETSAVPGVLVYGTDPAEAIAHVQALSLRILADRVEHGEPIPQGVSDLFAVTT